MGANLAIMVDQIRATEQQVGSTVAKAEPILVTSLTRRNWFSNGTFDDILQPWADGTLDACPIAQYSLTYLETT
jgi:hypothetical protein